MRDAGHRTPDAGHRTSDGEKSKNNISTPQGGGHNNNKNVNASNISEHYSIIYVQTRRKTGNTIDTKFHRLP